VDNVIRCVFKHFILDDDDGEQTKKILKINKKSKKTKKNKKEDTEQDYGIIEEKTQNKSRIE